MTNIRNLIKSLAMQETAMHQVQFLSPCVLGGKVRTKVSGLLHTFSPEPADFQGWGIFQPIDHKRAKLVEEASLYKVARYLKLFNAVRLRLAFQLQDQAWLAYPANESDCKQRFGSAKPVIVQLVTDGAEFEQIIARFDGKSFWFDELDRRASPIFTDEMRQALREYKKAVELSFQGLTPEMRTVYSIVESRERQRRQKELIQQQKLEQSNDHHRLDSALRIGGGALHSFRDRGDFWQVEWLTSTGEKHTSAISKKDLTVISSGICLSGYDREFDLQSLVKVIEQRD